MANLDEQSFASLVPLDAIASYISEGQVVSKYPNCLKACIRGLGYTIQEIAEETGISRRTLSSYCAGRVPIPQKALHTIAQVLGCSPDVLVPLRVQLRQGFVEVSGSAMA
jgi:transcriptional regulator with XRE-family HTH domain